MGQLKVSKILVTSTNFCFCIRAQTDCTAHIIPSSMSTGSCFYSKQLENEAHCLLQCGSEIKNTFCLVSSAPRICMYVYIYIYIYTVKCRCNECQYNDMFRIAKLFLGPFPFPYLMCVKTFHFNEF